MVRLSISYCAAGFFHIICFDIAMPDVALATALAVTLVFSPAALMTQMSHQSSLLVGTQTVVPSIAEMIGCS